ncbi:alpha/beta fold hydrolase [Xanthomarina sp. F2636L]|uniref:alpha/beta fold hydrolase n=1 Tax=Xanthomarina sp. F2636L TaxID=2996018 RepID=UPI00225E59B6|nr:alpha/beta hydrolase [Xanthomarina sp. F2636L]MCX7549650.1 alpha/beta hydrolase [Xanthomarina sp. F2636L]
MQSFFSNSVSKKDFMDLYYKKLNELDLEYEFLTIETGFGDTNIIVLGNINSPPLVLVHGNNSCAPMAIEKLKGLEKKFRIYAIDVLGQPNMSTEVRLNPKTDDYGKWMYEILSRLQIYKTYFVGISLGGFIGLKSLIYSQNRISEVFLIHPAGIVNGNRFEFFVKAYLPSTSFKIRKKTTCIKQFMKNTYTNEDAFTLKILSKLFLTYRTKWFSIPLMTTQEAQIITMPLNIIAAKDDYLFPGEKLLNRAQKLFPSLKKTILLENSKHVPSKDDYDRIKELILETLITSKK